MSDIERTSKAWDNLLQACRVASAASYAEGERAATQRIMAWLRSDSADLWGIGDATEYPAVADAIERNEHLQETSDE